MIPLIPLALSIISEIVPLVAPTIGKALAGANGEAVAKQVVDVAENLTGKKGSEVVAALKGDPNLVLQFQQSLMQMQVELLKVEIQSERDVIIAEAQSDSWITKNWRPVTMLTFVALVVAKWFGWTAPGITEALELELLTIIKYGLSGYVVGRSAEQIAKVIAPAIAGRA